MIFDDTIKDGELNRISKILDEPVDMIDLQGMANGWAKKDKALDELYALSANLKYANKCLEKYNIDKEKFKKIYKKLVRLGNGQWAGGRYVAASSLVFATTLEYVLEKIEKSSDEDLTVAFADIPNYLREMAFNLIEYFEKGKTGKVE